jgi:hypothetical protein
MTMPVFGGKPRPLSIDLPPGEEAERSVRATLLQGRTAMKGTLHMTNRRVMFEAEKGEARWMIVPYADVRSAGLYPYPGATMGIPSSRNQCLVVETVKGEQVWWDFGAKDEREWLLLVQAHVTAAAPPEGAESP